MAKLLRVNVSWLGHPDVYVDSVEDARRVVEDRCPGAVVDDFGGLVNDEVNACCWKRANWRRPSTGPSAYDGAIVLVYETEKPPRSLVELARDALAVQDACNLSGVVHGWSRAISDLWKQPGASTPFVNEHAINVLWADKVAHLTKTQAFSDDERDKRLSWAYDEVTKIVNGRLK